jgi:Large eukaryotic DNA virus major capsid protein/Major capsid protein N-terminus
MTGGGLIQIIANTGAQDIFLTSKPQITFFRTVYLRHTNFSIETIDEVFYNSEGFGKQCRCLLPRFGDLISGITLHIHLGSLNEEYLSKLDKGRSIEHRQTDEDSNICACKSCIDSLYKDRLIFGWANAIGHVLLKSMAIEIGGARIDKQYGEWLEIWSELTGSEEKKLGYYQMIGKVDPPSFTATTFKGSLELYVPLKFWFCRNYALALPIMGLCYHPVELIVDFRKFNECWVSNMFPSEPPKVPSFKANINIDYIYLDVDERKAFYLESQTYIIDQLQFTGDYPVLGTSGNIDFYFNHPVKELIWVLQRNDVITPAKGVYPDTQYPIGNDWFNYSTFQTPLTTEVEDTFENAVIQFNGTDRFRHKKASFFRLYQPYLYHTRIPINYIYVYSFAILPEQIYPTGTMNFSRVDNAKLFFWMKDKRTFTNYTFRAYAVNFNILLITAGMGGIIYND